MRNNANRGGNLSVVLLEFGVKGGRVSGQNRPNGLLPRLFVHWGVVASQAPTIRTAINLDGKTLAV